MLWSAAENGVVCFRDTLFGSAFRDACTSDWNGFAGGFRSTLARCDWPPEALRSV